MTGKTVLLSWVSTRLLTLLMLCTYASRVIGDVNYYRNALGAMHSVGLAHTLVEYPVAAVAVVGVPWLLSAGTGADAYPWLFLLFALATDGAFTWVLHRAGGRTGGELVWLLMVPALGAVTVTRFDLLPGVLVGLMILWHARRPRAAAFALAVATCVKLWPAILIPPLVAATRRRWAAVTTVGVVGTAAVVGTVALGGVTRLVSPLTYQGARGLQVEAVAATPAMVFRWLHPAGTHVWYAPSKAWEVTGPGVGALVLLTTVTSALFGLGLVAAWYRSLTTGRVLDSDALVWLVVASITGFIVLGRVFSPQYLLWLGPVCAAGLIATRTTRHILVRWTAGLLVAAVLTHLVFPVSYTGLLADDRPAATAVVILVVRNVVMVGLLALATRMAWHALARSRAEECGTLESDTVADEVVPSGIADAASVRS